MRIRKLKVIVAGGLFCVHFFSVSLETLFLVAKKEGGNVLDLLALAER